MESVCPHNLIEFEMKSLYKSYYYLMLIRNRINSVTLTSLLWMIAFQWYTLNSIDFKKTMLKDITQENVYFHKIKWLKFGLFHLKYNSCCVHLTMLNKIELYSHNIIWE